MPPLLCHSNEIQTKSGEDEFLLRDVITHKENCKSIETNSREWGISRRSFVFDVPHFDPFMSTPQNVMHIVLERCLPRIILCVLNYFINELSSISLSTFNDHLSNFPYCYFEKEKKTSKIMSHHIKKDKKLRQSASQMLQLARMMPFIISQYIKCSFDAYKCFLCLLKITIIVLSAKTSRGAIPYVRLLN